jgi:hypothetical protein
MEFADLKKKVESELKLEKPTFVQDTETSLNIGHIEMNPTQQLVFSVSSFKGKKYVDIRTWFQDQTGEWKPTKKGIHLSVEKFEDFKKLSQVFSEILSLDS